MSIAYKSGYKYQLAVDYAVIIPIAPAAPVITEYLTLDRQGRLTIKEGYAWDGPSGPAIDTRNFMRGSLVHDACYQLIRERHLGPECREAADRVLRTICLEDGMSSVRAWWVYWGVRWGGGPAADPAHEKPILRAP